ncbi:MAG: glycine--tRNA ligase [Candidatus Micrarchaeota archaeon]|nr:glycine--tRNA ligase [Candidatus Micrarchaeota archaeon]
MPELHERIFELAITRSFFFPSNEPYGNVSGFYDYGPTGVLIKHNIENLWRKIFIREEGAHEVETALVTPEIILKASGHVDNFADPVVECIKCKTRFRADHLVEKHVKDYHWDGKIETLDVELKTHKVTCNCKGELGKVTQFNLMFKTGIGGDQSPAYGRPETAQGIFTAFPRIFRNHGSKLPMAVAQIGKSFRNEISPRKGLVRMREFTQMELEYFFNPNNQSIEGFDKVAETKMRFKINDKLEWKTTKEAAEEKIASNEIMAYFLAKEWAFYKMCGLDENRMYFRVLGKDETPHYSKGNIDLEVETSYGVIEVNGNAYRTDYDLSQHAKFSKQPMDVFVEEAKTKLVPHVFEASLGVDRLFFCILEHCFRDKSPESSKQDGKLETQDKTQDPKPETGNGKAWEWFEFPSVIAPYNFAIFPLMKKDGLAEKAESIYLSLRDQFNIFHQETGSIGRRYARADEIGLPFAFTIDYDTLKDDTVTIRYRNDGKQERIKISDISKTISSKG